MISIGEKLDEKYVVVGRLGGGAFGDVYLAADEGIPGRQLALKALSADSVGDHGDLLWEMRTLAKFNHPGIVGFHHHFTHQSQLVLVMEYCAGGSLGHRLYSGRPISQDEVFRWGAVLCDALAFVHDKGIVHHDIKPLNILFSHDGTIKLGDFGVANRNGGTRRYMAPEMLLGESVPKTDPRVDVYALGLTLLEMLTGAPPFDLLSQDEAMKARISHDFVPDSLLRWVQEILLRATHPTPELRFQNMADFREAIIGKHVPYVFDAMRIKAHVMAEKAESQLTRKKWKSAENLVSDALRLCPDSATALLAAGRCYLLTRRIDKAKACFSRALGVNPRIHVQKELGWLNLEEGHLPIAISLLSDHLDRNAADFEAYNLLLKCFYLSERYEAGEELGRIMMKEKDANDCFHVNRFLCCLLNDGYTEQDLEKFMLLAANNPFAAYNLAVATEAPSSWSKDGKALLREKLIFQEYRFGLVRNAGKGNPIWIRLPDGSRRETSAPLVSIGSLEANDVQLSGSQVSRRHAVVVNLPDDVWLYDLASTCGTRRGEELICGRSFLDGVHKISVGNIVLDVAAHSDLLV